MIYVCYLIFAALVVITVAACGIGCALERIAKVLEKGEK